MYITKCRGIAAKDVRTDNNALLRLLSKGGKLGYLSYIVDKFGLTATDVRANENEALREACQAGHLCVVQYLVEHFKLTFPDLSDRRYAALRFASSVEPIIIESFPGTSRGEVYEYLVNWFNITPGRVREIFGPDMTISRTGDVISHRCLTMNLPGLPQA